MEKLLADVIMFYEAADNPVVRTPTILSPERKSLRIKLEDEEHEELLDALDADDLPAILQESLDKIYTSLATLIESGLINAAILGWEELQRSNMNKIDPITGKVAKRSDGKCIKPEGWLPVDWNAVIERARKGG